MRIFAIILPAIIAFIGIFSCKNTSEHAGSGGDRSKGGDNVVRIAEITLPASIFPHGITNTVEGLISSQIFEGLVKINPKNLTLMPGLAESWKIDPLTRSITFHLRKGLKFHRAKAAVGNEPDITSRDILFTFELLCTSRPGNVQFQTVCKDRIVGANEFYLASRAHKKIPLTGFKILDRYSFSIQLLNSPGIFLEILANPVAGIINPKAYAQKRESARLGAGPFILDEQTSTGTHFALYRNPDYYGRDSAGNHLPYIDSLVIDIASSTEEALSMFQNGRADFVNSVPAGQLRDIVEGNIKSFKNASYILDQRPEMISYYYLFNIHKAPLNNQKVRQAINFAIDRTRIVDRVLRGQAYGPAIHGIVPPTFAFYKINTIRGYELNIAKARKLLSEAGYPDGEGLPDLQLIVNSGNSRNSSVAAEIQRQLKNNLNINMSFESLSNAEKFNLQMKHKGDIFRDGWAADYPNPESFLSIFYSELLSSDSAEVSFPNTMRYKNEEFDRYYELGRDATNRDSSALYFLKAEQILVNDAPLIPLWYESNCRLIKSRMRNFYSNPLSYFDFTQVTLNDAKPEP